jgi:Anti-sigma factor NepR
MPIATRQRRFSEKVPPVWNESAAMAFQRRDGQPDEGAACLVLCCERLEFWEYKGEMKDMTKDILAGVTGRRRNGAGDPLGPNSEIGRKLKQYYDELVSDNVPDRFAQLLSQLEQAEPAQKKD